MKAAGENSYFIGLDLIDQAVLLIDPPGPAAGKLVLEGLWFA